MQRNILCLLMLHRNQMGRCCSSDGPPCRGRHFRHRPGEIAQQLGGFRDRTPRQRPCSATSACCPAVTAPEQATRGVSCKGGWMDGRGRRKPSATQQARCGGLSSGRMQYTLVAT